VPWTFYAITQLLVRFAIKQICMYYVLRTSDWLCSLASKYHPILSIRILTKCQRITHGSIIESKALLYTPNDMHAYPIAVTTMIHQPTEHQCQMTEMIVMKMKTTTCTWLLLEAISYLLQLSHKHCSGLAILCSCTCQFRVF